MKEKEVLIIIPAYNEAANIGKVLDQLEKPEISDIADILVMNDASVDATNWLVKARGHALVTHVFNLGYGSGIQLGYKYAVRRGYKYVIQMDADGQHDVCNIHCFIIDCARRMRMAVIQILCWVRALWTEAGNTRFLLRSVWHFCCFAL